MAVVLSKAADAHEAVQGAGALIAIHGAEFEQTQRKLTIRTLTRPEDQAVHRAVHRLHVVRAVVHLHRRIHAVFVEIEMAAGLEQVRVGEVRREHELIATVFVPVAAVVLHVLAHDGTLGMPHRQAAAKL